MTASYRPPFPSGPGCPQAEVTSLREATPGGGAPCWALGLAQPREEPSGG